jgi:hypothetical protein
VWEPVGTVDAKISTHNAALTAHGGVLNLVNAHIGAGGAAHAVASALLAGFLPALSGDAATFLNGAGAWSVPNALPKYDDWRWAPTGKATGPNNPARTAINGASEEVWEFTNGKILHADGNQLPHDYKEGTDIIPHIHWCPSTTGTYTGTWTMKYVGWLSMANGEPIEVERTVTVSFNAAMTAFQNQSADFSAVIPGAGRKISSVIHASLTLTLTAGTSCFLNGWDGHYLVDGFGSSSPGTK